jgi:hypothetical protein
LAEHDTDEIEEDDAEEEDDDDDVEEGDLEDESFSWSALEIEFKFTSCWGVSRKEGSR